MGHATHAGHATHEQVFGLASIMDFGLYAVCISEGPYRFYIKGVQNVSFT